MSLYNFLTFLHWGDLAASHRREANRVGVGMCFPSNVDEMEGILPCPDRWRPGAGTAVADRLHSCQRAPSRFSEPSTAQGDDGLWFARSTWTVFLRQMLVC